LLDHGANPNLATTGSLTPLFATIDQGWAARTWYPAASSEQQKTTHLELMQSLLDHGANPNTKTGPKLWFRTFHGDWVDPDGATAFWRAAQANDIPAMRLLLAHGADPKIATLHGSTPLQVAAGFGYQPQTSNFAPDARLATLKYLLEGTGADVNTADDKGYTPLHGAALMNNVEIIDYLVSKGGNVKARANYVYGRNSDTDEAVGPGMGDTVADMANGPREWNLQYPEIVDHLISLGSEFSDNCKAAQCVQKTREERKTKKP
jgi:ankyrin repeat protein